MAAELVLVILALDFRSLRDTVLALVRMAMGDPELDEHLLAFDSLTPEQTDPIVRRWIRFVHSIPTPPPRRGAREAAMTLSRACAGRRATRIYLRGG